MSPIRKISVIAIVSTFFLSTTTVALEMRIDQTCGHDLEKLTVVTKHAYGLKSQVEKDGNVHINVPEGTPLRVVAYCDECCGAYSATRTREFRWICDSHRSTIHESWTPAKEGGELKVQCESR